MNEKKLAAGGTYNSSHLETGSAYNGVTEWLDHRKISQNADQRLASSWFGETDCIKARALTVAVEMLPHFRN